MIGRRIPPVYSPVVPSSLLTAALGFPDTRVTLERWLLETFHAQHAVLTDSGTSALVLALRLSYNRRPVAMPGYACIDIIAAAERAGVAVVLYDTDAATLSPDIASLRQVLEAGARTIVVTPLFGYPVDIAAVSALASEFGATVLEDAAQGAGAELNGSRVGEGGDLTVVSFGRGKGSTGGSGGALLARRRDLVDALREHGARLQTSHARAFDVVALAAQWLLARPWLYALPAAIPSLQLGQMVYHPAREPARLPAMNARILSSAMKRDPHEVSLRRARAAHLSEAADRGRRLQPIAPIPGATPGYLRLAGRSPGRAQDIPVMGIVRPYPITLAEHDVTRRVLLRPPGSLSGAVDLRDRLLTVPTHSRLAMRDVERIARWLSE